MPELPEVETVVRELDKKLAGLSIAKVQVLTPKMISIGPQTVSNIRTPSKAVVRKFADCLTNLKIKSVKRRAKMLIFEFSEPVTMLVHLKMTGQFIYEDLKQKQRTNSHYRILNKKTAPLVKLPSKHTHAIFYFTDGSTLYFNDLRQFGYLKLIQSVDLSKVAELQNYGPEPLEKGFTFQIFSENLIRRKKLPIKLALMDPKIVAGIGNIYSDEILFLSGISPLCLVSELKTNQLQAIFDQIGPVLRNGIKYKGSSVGDFIRTDGAWGSMGKHHFVYGRKKQSCKRCGTMILAVKLGGRTACYCPSCQN